MNFQNYPRVIPGPPIADDGNNVQIKKNTHQRARNKVHWGLNNLVAFASQRCIQIVCPLSIQTVQSLYGGHKTQISCVRWADLGKRVGSVSDRGNVQRIVSGDRNGMICLWNVLEGKVVDVGQVNGMVLQIHWFDEHHILVLTRTGNLTMLNLGRKPMAKNWSLDLNTPILAMSLNPHKKSDMCLTGENGWIYFITDLNLSHAPKTCDKGFRVSGNAQNSISDLIYSPYIHDQLYLVSQHEVNVYDLQLRQPLQERFLRCRTEFRTIFLNPNGSNDLIFSWMGDSTVGAWTYSHETKKYSYSNCDVVRSSKHGVEKPLSLIGLDFSPLKEGFVAALDIQGKLWFWEKQEKSISPSQIVVSNESSAIKTKNKWILKGLLEGMSHSPTCVEVCPFRNVLAIGTVNGLLMMYDLTNSLIQSKLDISSNAIRGITWSSSHEVICYCSYKNDHSGDIHNLCVWVNFMTGETRTFFEDKRASGLIRAVRVSPSCRYMIVLIKKKPVELWNVEAMEIIRLLPVYNISAIDWTPLAADAEINRNLTETFIFASEELLHICRVQKGTVKLEQHQFKALAPVTAIAWKKKYLVYGDKAGNLNCYSVQKKDSRSWDVSKYAVKGLRASPRGPYVLLLLKDGSVQVWDLDIGKKIGTSSSSFKVVSISWTDNNHPVLALNTGAIVISDIQMTRCNGNILKRRLSEPMKSPALLSKEHSRIFRALLEQNQELGEFPSEDGITRNCYGELISDELQSKSLSAKSLILHGQLLPFDLDLSQDLDPMERLENIARYFSDKTAVEFWQVARNYKQRVPSEKKEAIKKHNNDKELVGPPIPEVPSGGLSGLFGLLRSDECIQAEELNLIQAHEKTVRRTVNGDLFFPVARNQAQLGQKEKAVQLLLDTPPSHPNLKMNYLHACVIAASNSPEHFEQTVLFVASSLISLPVTVENRDLDLGIELLCLIGEHVKALKIYQNFDMWEKASRLAKSLLSPEENREILIRWANYLEDVGQHIKAIGVWLSLGYFFNAVELLYQARMYDLAANFLSICEEENIKLFRCDEKLSIISDSSYKQPTPDSPETPHDRLVQELSDKVYEKYGKYLLSIGCDKLGERFTSKASKKNSEPSETEAGGESEPAEFIPSDSGEQEDVME